MPKFMENGLAVSPLDTLDDDRFHADALKLYTPPFRYERGYIFDAGENMVADKCGENIVQVRGWGRIGYMPDPEQMQDKIGEIIAAALTDFWGKNDKTAMNQLDEKSPKYRLLTNVDTISVGDEFLEDDCITWTPAEEIRLGVGAGYCKTLYKPIRRKSL